MKTAEVVRIDYINPRFKDNPSYPRVIQSCLAVITNPLKRDSVVEAIKYVNDQAASFGLKRNEYTLRRLPVKKF